MSPLTHGEAFSKLSAAAAGALDIEEERALRAHVADCSLCTKELEALRGLSDALRALPTPQPSAELLARVRRALGLELASRADERLNLLVAGFLFLFSWTVTVAGFLVFRLLTSGGLGLASALSGGDLGWSLSYFAVAWAGGAAAVVFLGMYERKRRMA